jgi:Uma2 family endonuclease
MSLAHHMNHAAHREYMSVQEYLRLEETATEKHEYRDGYRYLRHAGPYGFEAMAGARESHVRLAVRLARFVDEHLEGSPCILYNSDMHLATDEAAYYYPDQFVTCNPPTGPGVPAQQDATVVVEILSGAGRRDYGCSIKLGRTMIWCWRAWTSASPWLGSTRESIRVRHADCRSAVPRIARLSWRVSS